MENDMMKFSQRIERIRQDYDMNGTQGDKAPKQGKRRVLFRAGCDRRDRQKIVLYIELLIGRRAAMGR